MSDDLSPVQERRLLSLRLLVGTASSKIAPTSEQLRGKLTESGVSISQSAISNFFTRKAAVKETLARNIEKALKMGRGWMDADHAPYLGATASEIELLNLVLALPTQSKEALHAFLQALPMRDQGEQAV